jgi:DNA-binding transcriptional ArsR family regulator
MTDPLSAIPAPEFVISDLETLKVLADPLRLSIIENLENPSTVKDVAEKIQRPPTKLYYHFNLLEKHGLIRTVETRIVSGIVEKHYQAVARRYRVSWGLLSPTDKAFNERIEVMLGGIFGTAREDMRESIKAGVVKVDADSPTSQRVVLRSARSSLTAEQSTEFYSKLRNLLDEYGFIDRYADVESPEKQLYRLTLLLHPSSRDGRHKKKNSPKDET